MSRVSVIIVAMMGIACSARDFEVDGNDVSGISGSGGRPMSPAAGGKSPASSGGANVAAGGRLNVVETQGGDAGAAGDGGAGGDGNAPPRRLECESPKALSGGYVECKNGFLHRTEPGVCPNHVVKTGGGGAPGAGGDTSAYDDCVQDSDCGSDPLSFCGNEENWQCVEPDDRAYCLSGCERDSDCRAGEICLCGDAQLTGQAPLGQCVKASCQRDSDCAPGYLCVSSPGLAWIASFSCQSPEDECGGNEDCSYLGIGGEGFGVPVPWEGAACSRVGSKRVCNTPGCSP